MSEAVHDDAESAGLESLLEYLRRSRGFDFTAYKRSSLSRRILKRMQTAGVEGFERYAGFLERHPEEFAALFNTILINVTSFFRDAEVWELLRSQVLPQLLESRDPADPIRVWSAGCASGQEAYTAIMVLSETIGLDAVRARVKLYATDADDEALAEARRAQFSDKQLADLPASLADHYFVKEGDVYTFHRDLRRCVIFGRHDLIQDAPISRVDLLLCRNTLMYFNSDAQAKIMGRFQFSLGSGGLLVLGRAEMLASYGSMFHPVNLKHRIFRVSPRARRNHPPMIMAAGNAEVAMSALSSHGPLREAAFDTAPDAQIVLDAGGQLAAVNAAARRQFNLTAADIGTPLQDLEVSYRPAELRPGLDDARRERRDVTLARIPVRPNGQMRYIDITISPFFENDTPIGSSITFTDVTALKSLEDELVHSKHELETAYEELQSTNEELETTNEELQSTVEELETTNEELQSTNEELETMNEELQSTNEELQTMNDELRSRSGELNAFNAFLESVFSSLGTAVVVLDRDLRIDVWNRAATELWGLRGDETHRAHFFNLDFGLPLAELHQPLRDVMHGSHEASELTIAAVNRKGRALRCRVKILPLRPPEGPPTGAILLMDEVAGG